MAGKPKLEAAKQISRMFLKCSRLNLIARYQVATDKSVDWQLYQLNRSLTVSASQQAKRPKVNGGGLWRSFDSQREEFDWR